MTAHETGLALYDLARRDAARRRSSRSTRRRSAWRAACCSAPRCGSTWPSVYALVRIADEIVDGAGRGGRARHGGMARAARRPRGARPSWPSPAGYSSNLVVHAFARTARTTGIGVELTRPVLRVDAARPRPGRASTPTSFARYVYGSAEVVGLMCLRAFRWGRRRCRRATRDARARRAPPRSGIPEDQLPARPRRRLRRARPSATSRASTRDRLRRGRQGADPRRHRRRPRDRRRGRIPELPGSCRRAVAAAHAPVHRASRRDCAARPPSELLTHAGAGAGPGASSPLLVRAATATAGGRRRHDAASPSIGGGIAGLATAALLARDGHEVTVSRRTTRSAGAPGSWERDGLPLRHRAVVVPHARGVRPLLPADRHELGRAARPDPARSRLPRLLRAVSRPARRARRACRRDSPLFECDRARRRALPSSATSTPADETARLALDHFLYTTSRRPPRCSRRRCCAASAASAGCCSSRLDRFIAGHVRDPRLRQVLGYPAVFLGSSPFAAPSLYHLMSHLDLDDGVLYPHGRVPRGDRQRRAPRGASGCAVSSPAPGSREHRRCAASRTGRPLSRRRRDDVTRSPPMSSSRRPTCTTPRPSCCRPRRAAYPEASWRRADPGPGAVLVMLGVRGELPELAPPHAAVHRGLGRQLRPHLRRAIRGARPGVAVRLQAERASTPTVAPAGHENLFVLVPVPADPAIGRGGVDGAGDATRRALADAAIAQIAEWAGIPDLARPRRRAPHHRARRLRRGPQLVARHRRSARRTRCGRARSSARATRVEQGATSLYYAGATTIPGIGLPMCLISAELVVEGAARRRHGCRSRSREHRHASAGRAHRALRLPRALLASIAGMVLLDRAVPARSSRAGARCARRSCSSPGSSFFLAWDLAGIALGIFFRAENPVSTGIVLAPELPLEEVVLPDLPLLSDARALHAPGVRALASRATPRAARTALEPREVFR